METLSNEELLKKIYYDPKRGLGGLKKLYDNVNKIRRVDMKAVKAFFDRQSTSQVYKERKVRNHYPLISYSPFSRVQVDLLDIRSENPNRNGGNKYIYLCIDVFSRYALGIPIKDKTDKACLIAFKAIIANIKDLGFSVRTVDSDNEAAFTSKIYSKYCEENNIIRNLNDPGDHKSLGVIDRFCRTLRGLIRRYTDAYSTQKFINVLDDFLYNYNNSVNRTLQMSPVEAISMGGISNYISSQTKKAKEQSFNTVTLKIGDKVRLLKRKSVFEKGQNTFSKTIHTIENIREGRFYVNDRTRGYRKSELLKVDEKEDLPPVQKDYNERVESDKIEKRITRAMNKEGVQKKGEDNQQERDEKVLRKYRKPRGDLGPMIFI